MNTVNVDVVGYSFQPSNDLALPYFRFTAAMNDIEKLLLLLQYENVFGAEQSILLQEIRVICLCYLCCSFYYLYRYCQE